MGNIFKRQDNETLPDRSERVDNSDNSEVRHVMGEQEDDVLPVVENIEHHYDQEVVQNREEHRQQIEPPTHEAVALKGPLYSHDLVLHCSKDKSRTKKTLTFQEHPQTVAQVKEHIQNTLHIPSCCQEIHFDSIRLKNEEQLQSYRIRNGDTLHVHYSSEADVEEVLDIIASMHKFIEVQSKYQSGSEVASYNFDDIYYKALLFSECIQRCFHTCAQERADVNLEFFVGNRGPQVLHQLHMLLLKQPWHKLWISMQYVESVLLLILVDITVLASTRKALYQLPVLDAALQSLLRAKVPPDDFIRAPPSVDHDQRLLDSLLTEAIGTAVTFVCNLCEILPRCRLQIASNPAVLEQLMAAMISPTFTVRITLCGINGIQSLAYSPETHLHIAKPNIIDGILKACDRRSSESRFDHLYVKYRAAILYAEIIVTSASSLPLSYKLKIQEFLAEFLRTADHRDIHRVQNDKGYIWSTTAPIVKLAYYPCLKQAYTCTCPDYSPEDNYKMRNLESLCMEIGILSLQNAVLCETTRQILVTEEVVDYVTCIPWHVPEGSNAQKRALELVSFLRQTEVQLQPPPLVTIVKAKLAAMHFGLEKVLEANSVHQLLNEVYA